MQYADDRKSERRAGANVNISLMLTCVLLGIAHTAMGQSEKATDPYPETPQEIAVYKDALIEDYLQRAGNPEKTEAVHIDSLTELLEYSAKSNVHVRMEPGIYKVTLDNFTKFISTSPER